MSYQVIARKYRPQRFEDVVGQEHVTQTLANAIAAGRIAHAYLFCGPRGTGKTTIARIFAKALNCTGGPSATFPDDDPRVKEITDGRSLDVLEIDGASNNGVEQVRELRDTCRFAPASSKFKIYIIDEVHMLSTAAFNALLKTLEEPPAHVKFLFATTDPQKVLPTILSRTQRFDLRRIPTPMIAKHLSWIAGREGVKIDDAALYAVARAADGGLRDAESTLDQLISFCGNDIAEADVLSMFGLSAQSQILALVRAVIDGQAEPALRELNSLAKQGKDLSRLLTDLLGHFRNLLVFQVSKGDLSLLEVSEAEAQSLAELAPQIGADGLARVLEVLTDAEGRFRDATSKKILLEVTLIRAIEARQAVSIDAVLRQLNVLRKEAGSAVSNPSPNPSLSPAPQPTRSPAHPPVASAPSPAPVAPARPVATYTPPPATQTAPAPAPVQAAIPPADLPALWGRLVGLLTEPSTVFLKNYLLKAFPVSATNNLFTIGFPSFAASDMTLADNPVNQSNLRKKLAELGMPNAQVKFVVAQPPADWTPPASPISVAPTPAASIKPAPTNRPAATPAQILPPPPPALTKEDFKNDPLIQKALEVFKGEIVDFKPAGT